MNDLTKEAVKIAGQAANEAADEFGSYLSDAHKNATVNDVYPFKDDAVNQLTDEQKASFNRDGFLVVKGLLSKDKIEKYTQRLIDIASKKVAAPKNMLVMKDVMIAKGQVKTDDRVEMIQKIQDIQDDPVLWEFLTEPAILDIVENFAGKNMKTIHNMLINKPPNLDGRHPFHQDQLYFPFGPDESIIGCWIALQKTNRENGTLAVIPGSHRSPVMEHGDIKSMENLNLAYFGAIGDFDVKDRVHIEAEPGDALFFHTHLLHGTGKNRTDGFRRVFIAHYASSDCRFRENGEAMAAIRHYTQVRGEGNPDPKTI